MTLITCVIGRARGRPGPALARALNVSPKQFKHRRLLCEGQLLRKPMLRLYF